MKPFVQAEVPKDEINRLCTEYLKAYRHGDKLMLDTFGADNPNIKDAIKSFLEEQYRKGKVYRNDTYQVAVREYGEGQVHLSIRRIDRVECHDWRDFQEIKNIFIGKECEAMELYPAESRVVDTANQYHIFGTKVESFRFPCGFYPAGPTRSESEIGGSKQRKFDEPRASEAAKD